MADLEDRVVALEQRMAIAEEQRRQLQETANRMEEKLDRLLTAAAMGKGAWWAMTKVGGTMVMAAGAFGWLVDHFHWWSK